MIYASMAASMVRSGVPWGTIFPYILILKVLRGTIFRISIQPILKFLLILLIENILCTGTHRPAASNRVAWRLSAASPDDRTQMPYSGHLWPGPIEVRSSGDAAVRSYSSLTSGRCSYPMYW